METSRAINIATQAVRKGGTIQLVGLYGTRYSIFPLGDTFAQNITVKIGQASVIHYMPAMYQLIEEGKLDPTDIDTHKLPLDEA